MAVANCDGPRTGDTKVSPVFASDSSLAAAASSAASLSAQRRRVGRLRRLATRDPAHFVRGSLAASSRR